MYTIRPRVCIRSVRKSFPNANKKRSGVTCVETNAYTGICKSNVEKHNRRHSAQNLYNVYARVLSTNFGVTFGYARDIPTWNTYVSTRRWNSASGSGICITHAASSRAYRVDTRWRRSVICIISSNAARD